MNNLTVLGRITKDAETRTVKVKGIDTLVTDFTLAVNDGYGETRTTDYFRVSIWRERGAKMADGLKKGRPVIIKGAVTARAWKDNDGNARAQLEIRNPQIEFFDKKPGEEDDGVPFVEE